MAEYYDISFADGMSVVFLGMSGNFILLRQTFASATAPSNPVKGQVWYKDLGSNLYQKYTFNGISWIKELAGDGVAGRMVQWSGAT